MDQEQFEPLLDDATHAVIAVLKQAGVNLNFAGLSAVNDALESVLRDVLDVDGEVL